MWRREVLDRAGGIRALACEIAEDAASTKVIRAQNMNIRLVDMPFEQPLGDRSAREVYSRHVPELFTRKGADGKLLYAVPGWDVTTVDYLVALGMHKAPLSPRINLRNISEGFGNPTTLLHMNEYLARRGEIGRAHV